MKDLNSSGDSSDFVTASDSDYQILSFIGRGGYGEVWLASDRQGRHWAVKVVHRSGFDHDRPYEREYQGILKFFPVSSLSEGQLRVIHVGRRGAPEASSASSMM